MTSAEHHAQAEQLLAEARQARTDRRPVEESDALRAEAAIHASLSVGAALRKSATAPRRPRRRPGRPDR